LQINRVNHEIENTGIAEKKINKAFYCEINARGEILPSFIVLSHFFSQSLAGSGKVVVK
jgi:hypothetical protein